MTEASHPADALPPKIAGEERADTVPPKPYFVVAHIDAPFEKQVLDVPQT
ncbi:hypothetical protein [Novosphingobium sp. 17-62-19]|nr:hypothetical protein [Novosphingobium sp. 17-62-19]HQS96333.1 hypothetical protein [Novosphingobium sp.]